MLGIQRVFIFFYYFLANISEKQLQFVFKLYYTLFVFYIVIRVYVIYLYMI